MKRGGSIESLISGHGVGEEINSVSVHSNKVMFPTSSLSSPSQSQVLTRPIFPLPPEEPELSPELIRVGLEEEGDENRGEAGGEDFVNR